MKTGYPTIDKPWLTYYSSEALDSPFPSCTLKEYIWEGNKDHLSNVALEYFGREILYRELFDHIEEAAHAFYSIGVRKGDVVVLVTVTTPETIYTLYGLNSIGAICNMVDPRTSIEGMHEYIAECGAKVVLSLDVVLSKVSEAIRGTAAEKVIVTSPSDSLPFVKRLGYKLSSMAKGARQDYASDVFIRWRDFLVAATGDEIGLAPYEKDTCAVIVHTGGTTGSPKGVMLSNDNLNASTFECQVSGMNMRREHSWLNIMPPFIAYGVGNGLHLPLAIGMKVILIPSFDPEKFDDLLLKHKPNHMVGVPSHYGSFLSSKKLAQADLSFIIEPTVGGDTMELGLEERTNQFLHSHGCRYKVVKGYGLTEVCAAVSVCVSDECNELGSVGIPNVGITIAIFDPVTGEELPYGESGEVCITGPNTMLGYYGNETATRDILREHDDGLTWVHSGDVGHMSEEGFLFIEGRIKRMIVRHDGFKVFPSFIENVLVKCPDVSACCVVGIKDDNHIQGERPLAFVVLNASTGKVDTSSIINELMELCNRELPEYAQPAHIKEIDELPLTPIGKVDYLLLEQLAGK